MSNDKSDRAEQKPDEIGKFLTFRSHISRGWYFLGLLGEIVFLFIALVAFAGLNNPTGGGSLELAVVFAIIALWLHATLVIGRLRDAGAPILLGIILALAPFVWIAFTLEYVESLGWIMAIVFIGLYLLPALFKPKAETVTQP